uniref:Uncharacterized protein n=1 Tax=Toxoplasma gondii (strain ATCC 50861 / VEG) TaxID=432359 RepID=A0A0F7UU28_TOXGV|nr:TPA: hypothetical protein BN1205_044150 [Toxoplasma gondii VEG]
MPVLLLVHVLRFTAMPRRPQVIPCLLLFHSYLVLDWSFFQSYLLGYILDQHSRTGNRNRHTWRRKSIRRRSLSCRVPSFFSTVLSNRILKEGARPSSPPDLLLLHQEFIWTGERLEHAGIQRCACAETTAIRFFRSRSRFPVSNEIFPVWTGYGSGVSFLQSHRMTCYIERLVVRRSCCAVTNSSDRGKHPAQERQNLTLSFLNHDSQMHRSLIAQRGHPYRSEIVVS